MGSCSLFCVRISHFSAKFNLHIMHNDLNITDLVIESINTKGSTASGRPAASSSLLLREGGKHKQGAEE